MADKLSFLFSPGAHLALPGTDPIKFAEKHGIRLGPVEEQVCSYCKAPKPMDTPFVGKNGVYGVMSSPCKSCGDESNAPYCLILPNDPFKRNK